MVVAVAGNALVGTGWSNSCLGYTNRLRKHHSHLIGVPFPAVKAIQVLKGFCWLRMLTSLLMSGCG